MPPTTAEMLAREGAIYESPEAKEAALEAQAEADAAEEDAVEADADAPEEPEDSEDDESDQFPKHTGGGWYELSNGEKVQGQEAAEEAESKL